MTERQFEQHRVNQVITLIQQRLKALKKTLKDAQHETTLVERNYVQNARINTFEIDDQMETNAEVQQQKQLVAKNLQDQAILKHQIKQLNVLEKSPYFGRIDIKQEAEQPETLYIGTSSLLDDKQNFLIYDWRAPICEIYYNGTLGKVNYQTPAGKQCATLLKKRQFTIVAGQIKHMFDTNETIGDEILQSVLSEHSDEYMKNIVATIQQEQNAIIRDTTSDLLIVQGVAGSGKTSAILQRIAYLLYHSQHTLAADQIILFSPNLLFSHYISEVLPSLGEKNMRQLTLSHFLTRRLEGLKVQSLFERYEQGQPHVSELKFKETKQIMLAVQNYVTHLTSEQICFSDIYFEGTILFHRNDIAKYYASFPKNLTGPARFLATKNLLIKRLNRLIKIQTHCDWVNEQIANLSSQQLQTLLAKCPKEDVNAKQQFLARHLLKKRYAKIYEALYNDYFIDTYAQYEHFLINNKLPASAKAYAQNLEFHRIALSDCAPLLYLRDLLTGSGQNHQIAHLFIDEMQDYSQALLLYLQHAFPKAKLTLLGDSQQALFQALIAPDALLTSLSETLQAKKPKLVKLNKSYRCTYQITNFAKYLIPQGQEIQAFKRQGPLPKLILAPNSQIALQILRQQVKQAASSLAIITKDAKQAALLANYLADLKVNLVTTNDQKLPAFPVVLPIYLAKGLEFDNVLAYDISQKQYQAKDSAILYTLCSRAMHELTLIGIGEFPTVFKTIPSSHYQLKQIYLNT